MQVDAEGIGTPVGTSAAGYSCSAESYGRVARPGINELRIKLRMMVAGVTARA